MDYSIICNTLLRAIRKNICDTFNECYYGKYVIPSNALSIERRGSEYLFVLDLNKIKMVELGEKYAKLNYDKNGFVFSCAITPNPKYYDKQKKKPTILALDFERGRYTCVRYAVKGIYAREYKSEILPNVNSLFSLVGKCDIDDIFIKVGYDYGRITV